MKPRRIISLVLTYAALMGMAACARKTSAVNESVMKESTPTATRESSLSERGRDEECKAEYSIKAPTDVAMNEEIKVSFTAPANHDPQGWIGVFSSGDNSKNGIVVARASVGAAHQCSGSVTLKGLPTGDYDIYYFLDDGREKPGPRSKLTAHTPV
jgi:hypothetical protein